MLESGGGGGGGLRGTPASAPAGRFISRFVEIKDWRSLAEKDQLGIPEDEAAAWRTSVAPKLSANSRRALKESDLVVEWEVRISFKLWLGYEIHIILGKRPSPPFEGG